MTDSNKAKAGRESPERSGIERSEVPRSGGDSLRNSTSSSNEIAARPRRRQFSNAYKLQIVREADACKRPGDIGALLRREGLYSVTDRRMRATSGSAKRIHLGSPDRVQAGPANRIQ